VAAAPDIIAAIEGGALAPIYCLHGEDRYSLDRALAAIRRAALGADADRASSFNLETFELKERGLGAALDAARTLPMFAKLRLVIGRGIDDLDSEALEPLAAYVADPNPKSCLVLVAGGKVDGRLRAFLALRKAGYLHEFAPLKDWQLAEWVLAEARRRKLALHPEAARVLADSAGPDLGRIALALEQVALYAGADVKLTSAHVEAVVPESRERSVFELTKAIGSGDREHALRLLANMMRNREPPLRIQFMLARQIRQVWRAKELQGSGISRNDLAAQIGVPAFFLDDILAPARRMTLAGLERSLSRLHLAERAFKTSNKVDPEIQLARLVRALADEGKTDSKNDGGRR
jgi:DNA polymerase-3 subunit delta